MAKPYEMMVLFDTMIGDESIKKAQSDLEALITTNGGTIESRNDWGKRELAYEIDGKRSAVYSVILFEGDGDLPENIEKALKLNTDILRYMLLVRDPAKVTVFNAPPRKTPEERGEEVGEDSEENNR